MRGEALVAVVCALSLPGCTLAGAGIGAGIDGLSKDRFEAKKPDEVRLSKGDKIVVWTHRGERSTGRFAGTLAPTPADPRDYLLLDPLETDEGSDVARIPKDEIRSVGVKIAGKGWLYGGLIGLGVDVTVVVATLVVLGNSNCCAPDLKWGT